MTNKKTLKQRVRERQEKTGERYTTALSHVRAMAPEPVQVELHEVSRAAELEGFACQAFASEALWQAECNLGAPEARFRGVLLRLRTLLQARSASQAAAKVASLLLQGDQAAVSLGSAVEEMFIARDFIAQAQAGVRGVARNGRLVVFDVPRGEAQAAVVAVVMASPFPREGRGPVLWLSGLGERGEGLGGLLEQHLSLAGIGGWSRGP